MSNVFGIFYYIQSYDSANVKLLSLCSSHDKCMEIIKENFHDYFNNVNNSIICKNKNNIQCVLWINKYEIDKQFGDNGLACNQPNCSVQIIFDIS